MISDLRATKRRRTPPPTGQFFIVITLAAQPIRSRKNVGFPRASDGEERQPRRLWGRECFSFCLPFLKFILFPRIFPLFYKKSSGAPALTWITDTQWNEKQDKWFMGIARLRVFLRQMWQMIYGNDSLCLRKLASPLPPPLGPVTQAMLRWFLKFPRNSYTADAQW